MPGEPTDHPRFPPLPVTSSPTPGAGGVVPLTTTQALAQRIARSFVRVQLDQGFSARLPRPAGLSDVQAKTWTYLPTPTIDAPFDELGRFYGYSHRVTLGFADRLCHDSTVGLRFTLERGLIGRAFRRIPDLTLTIRDHRITRIDVVGRRPRRSYATADWQPLPEHEAVVEFILGQMTHAMTDPTVIRSILSTLLGKPHHS